MKVSRNEDVWVFYGGTVIGCVSNVDSFVGTIDSVYVKVGFSFWMLDGCIENIENGCRICCVLSNLIDRINVSL